MSKQTKFMAAKPGEWWRIDDEWVRLYNRPILVRNEERDGYPLYFLLNKYTPLFCTPHLIDPLVPQYKCVYIMETRGYLGRWKHIKYCRTDEDGRIIEQEPGFWIVRGWILGTEVWKAKKVRESKQQKGDS